jgi:hypothetical protein
MNYTTHAKAVMARERKSTKKRSFIVIAKLFEMEVTVEAEGAS